MSERSESDPREALTDSEKLLVLAAWFDMWDRPETDRQAILDDPRNPGRNDVQADLRRISAALAQAAPPPALPDPSWCDCNYEPVRGIKAGRHLPSCRYGIVLDYLDISDPRADTMSAPATGKD